MCHPSWVHSPGAHGTSPESVSKFVVDLTKTYREIRGVPPCCREVTNKQRMAQNAGVQYGGVQCAGIHFRTKYVCWDVITMECGLGCLFHMKCVYGVWLQ